MEKLLENPIVVKMFQTIAYDTMMTNLYENKDYLNECSINEFVKITELIRDDDEFNLKIIKDLVYNIIYRKDLKPVCNMILCNLIFYLEKFDEIDYKYHEYMIESFSKDLKSDSPYFSKYLLKYLLELLLKNMKKFKPEVKSDVLDLLLEA